MAAARIHDRVILDALEALDPEPFRGTVWRVTRSGREPLRGAAAHGRWSSSGEFEVLYTSLLREGALGEIGYAQDAPEETSAKFQATYVWQRKYPFVAAYSGAHSLSPDREKSYSFTATAALGTRTWRGGEFYFDPEVAQGVPLSGLTGLGGFTNG